MPALPNPKNELFAQNLALGKKQVDAYELAGYPRHRSNASKLARTERIRARVAEIIGERAEAEARRVEDQRVAEEQATKRAAEKLALDREWVLRRLQVNVELSLRGGVVKGTDQVDRVTERNPAAANAALRLIGQELGMFREQPEEAPPAPAVQVNLSLLSEAQLAALDEILKASEEAGLPGHDDRHSGRAGKTTH